MEDLHAQKKMKTETARSQRHHSVSYSLHPSGEEQKGQGGKAHISEPKDNLLSG